ncbi:peptidoglycan-binding domain-containing protein [Rhizobium leguminosarum]|uniref:Peptidoglycan binding-like domain-containing protein n=1 Tax=Rhizobium leguminosarum TaxID=384 RepID=A0A7K3VK78_RHILE|nr:peptidoglycan-binding domain-containing protein [Rhizobium leguminosarum]NEK17162.1 hypothetical protein [Rhizobium leguminosarum]
MPRFFLHFAIFVGLAVLPFAEARATDKQLLNAIIGGGLRVLLDNGGGGPPASPRNRERTSRDHSTNQPVEITDDEEPPLTRQEMRNMQSALSDLGFDVGKADGRGGVKTGRAVAKFLSDRGLDPYQTSVHTAYQMITDAADGADAQLLSNPSPDAMTEETSSKPVAEANLEDPGLILDWDDNGPAARDEFKRLGREFVRRIATADASLLEDDQRMASWLRAFSSQGYGIWPSPEMDSLAKKYSDGTEFDRQAALGSFRQFLQANATAEPMQILRIRRISVGPYDFEKQAFPIDNFDKPDVVSSELFFRWSDFPNVYGEDNNWQAIDSVPFAKDHAEEIAARLAKSQRIVDVSAVVTLSDFKIENSSGRRGIVAKAEIQKVSLHFRDRDPGKRLGEVFADITAPDVPADSSMSQTPAAKDAFESWVRLGVPVANGRLFMESESDSTPALRKAWDLLLLASLNKPLDSLNSVHYFSRLYLSKGEFASLFGRNTSSEAMSRLRNDVFRIRDIIGKFNQSFRSGLVSQSPQLPVSMTLLGRVGLGAYNFETHSFPIAGFGSASLSDLHVRLNLSQGLPMVETDLVKLPTELPMKEQDARRLNRLAVNGSFSSRLDLFSAITFELDGLGSVTDPSSSSQMWSYNGASTNELRSAPSGQVTRLQIFEDRERKRLIADIPLDSYRPKAAVQKEQPGTAVPAGLRISRWNIAALTQKLGAGDEILSRIIEASTPYRNANEFERADVKEQMTRLAAQAVPDTTKPMFLMGQVQLGEYGEGAFPIVKWSFSVTLETDRPQIDGSVLSIAAENSDALLSFKASKDIAPLLAKTGPGRVYSALFRIRPLRSERLDGTQSPFTRLDVAIDEVLLLYPGGEDRVIASSRAIAPGNSANDIRPALLSSPEKAVVALQPDRMPLTPETVALMLSKYSGTEPDDRALSWLLKERWNVESAGNRPEDRFQSQTSAWGRFFPDNYHPLSDKDVERLLPIFRHWNASRLEHMPNKLIYDDTNNYSSPYANFTDSPRYYAPVMAQLGIAKAKFSGGASPFDVVTVDGMNVGGGGIMGLRRELNSNARFDAFMLVPNLPLPKNGYGEAMSLYMDIRNVAVGAGPDGLPQLALDVSPTEVRWWGAGSAVSERPQIGTFKLEAAKPVQPTVYKDLDIVGLRLGKSQIEAEKILSDHMKMANILELRSESVGTNVVGESARLYISDDGMDLITVLYGPTALDPKVYGVTRTLNFALNSFSKAQAYEALIEKYGPLLDESRWRWGETANDTYCADLSGNDRLNWIGAKVISGSTPQIGGMTNEQMAADPAVALTARIARRAASARWGQDLAQGIDYKDCTEVVVAEFQELSTLGFAGEKIPEGETIVLSTWLMDHAKHRAAFEAARTAPVVSNPAKPPANLKL